MYTTEPQLLLQSAVQNSKKQSSFEMPKFKYELLQIHFTYMHINHDLQNMSHLKTTEQNVD